MNSILHYIEKFITEEYELKVIGDVFDVGTTAKQVIAETVPADKEGLILYIATDNTLEGEIDLKVEGRSVEGSPWDCRSFPSNKQPMYIMVHVPPRSKYEVYARGLTSSITIPIRVGILLKKVT